MLHVQENQCVLPTSNMASSIISIHRKPLLGICTLRDSPGIGDEMTSKLKFRGYSEEGGPRERTFDAFVSQALSGHPPCEHELET